MHSTSFQDVVAWPYWYQYYLESRRHVRRQEVGVSCYKSMIVLHRRALESDGESV